MAYELPVSPLIQAPGAVEPFGDLRRYDCVDASLEHPKAVCDSPAFDCALWHSCSDVDVATLICPGNYTPHLPESLTCLLRGLQKLRLNILLMR